MAGRRTNQALLVLTAGAVSTGLGMFALGTGWNRWVTVAHGAIGLAMVALAPWKAVIARRGLRHRGPGPALPSLALVAVVVTAIGTGFAHRAGVRPIGPVDVLQVHVASAVVAIVLTTVHLRTRPVPLPVRATDLDRRAALRAGLVGAGATLTTVGLPHASHRFTRSLERGSFEPSAMPVTQWFLDEVPVIDPGGWQVVVAGRSWSLDQLSAASSSEVTATLDCTGGWYAHQRWTGVELGRLLADSGAGAGRSIAVRSSTGYERRFPRADASRLLLATAAAGQPLSPGHGFPARLVAPGRRGFWWVKWVAEIDVDQRPWWWQLPFPLR